MKTVFFFLCFIFLSSCDVTDPPTGACKWGALKDNCTETTYDDCKKAYNGDWYGREHCN